MVLYHFTLLPQESLSSIQYSVTSISYPVSSIQHPVSIHAKAQNRLFLRSWKGAGGAGQKQREEVKSFLWVFTASPIIHLLVYSILSPFFKLILAFFFLWNIFNPPSISLWWGVISSQLKLVPGQQNEELPTFLFWKVAPPSHKRTLHVSNQIPDGIFQVLLARCQWWSVSGASNIAQILQTAREKWHCKDTEFRWFGSCHVPEIVLWRC